MTLNIIDIGMAIVMTAVIFIGRKEGLIAGLFKLFGIFCVIAITLHYYRGLAEFLRANVFGDKIETEFMSFVLLALPTALTFILICHGWILILRFKPLAMIDRWCGLILALIRSYFVCGLLFVALVVSGNSFIVPRALTSLSKGVFGYAAVGFYGRLYASFIQRYFPREKINEHPFMAVSQDPGKKAGR